MANPRIKRDIEDRLADRVQETKERIAESDPDNKSKRERAEAFRDKWQNSALPVGTSFTFKTALVTGEVDDSAVP